MPGDVVTFTERLVSVDTAPARSTDPLVELLVTEARDMGADVRVQRGELSGLAQSNLVLRWGGDGPAGLVLAGHLDTVPWEAGQRATIRPERDGRTLYGRGTCDMKGAVAAQLLAAHARASRLRRPLVLAWTYGEEVGCHGAERLVADPTVLGDVSEAVCIVGEPTDLRPIVGHKGYAIARLLLRGEPAHSSDPWAGADASVALATLLRDLHELREALRREGLASDLGELHDPPCTTLNTGLVSAGTARNVVPDRAEVVLECRPLPGADVVDLRRRIEACLALACGAAEGVTGRIEWIVDHPAFHQSTRHALVDWLRARTGGEPDVVPFYTEAELYRGGLDVPTVVCGPGSIRNAHRVEMAGD